MLGRKMLYAGLLLFCSSNISAQNNDIDSIIIDKSIRQFVSQLSSFSEKTSIFLFKFKDGAGKNIFIVNTPSHTNLNNYLLMFKSSSVYWNNTPDKKINVPESINNKCKLNYITQQRNKTVTKNAGDLSIYIDPIMQDSLFKYVIMDCRMKGDEFNNSAYFIFKYNFEGTLLKTDYVEMIE